MTESFRSSFTPKAYITVSNRYCYLYLEVKPDPTSLDLGLQDCVESEDLLIRATRKPA